MAERALLSMMFTIETLEVSSVKGKIIRKGEPARQALNKDLVERLIGKYALLFCITNHSYTHFVSNKLDRQICIMMNSLLNYSSPAPLVNL